MRLFRPARRYRHNWALFDRRVIGDPADPLMIRWRLVRIPAFGVFVHRICRPDNDRAVHDHPWPFTRARSSRGETSNACTLNALAYSALTRSTPERTV